MRRRRRRLYNNFNADGIFTGKQLIFNSFMKVFLRDIWKAVYN